MAFHERRKSNGMRQFFSCWTGLCLLVLLSGVGVSQGQSSSTDYDLSAAITDWLPAVNAFESSNNISSLNSAYQFGVIPSLYTTYYGNLPAGQTDYFVFDITELKQVVKITLFRSDNPKQTAFFPGVVLMGRDRLNIDKSTEFNNYFPASVQVPVGYDTYVRFNNEANDFMPIYIGLIPFSYYQMLTFNTSELLPGIYVVAVFNSVNEGATEGAYALALGTDITLTFDDFMLGPFYAFVTYTWQGYGAGLILIPYWIIIGIGALIIGHQTFYRGNSPRSWYSMFTVIGGFLIVGSGCVVVAQLAYSFLQVPTPISDSLTSVGYTVAFFVGPLFCGITIVFFGLMHHANKLVRLCVLFLAVGSCLVWASYYIGPGIAVIGALLPSSKNIPFYLCCRWMKKFDEEEGNRQLQVDADDDNWDRRYEDGPSSDSRKPTGKGAPTPAPAASAASSSKPFPIDEPGVHHVGDDSDDTETDEDHPPVAVTAAQSTTDPESHAPPPIHVAREDASSDEDTSD